MKTKFILSLLVSLLVSAFATLFFNPQSDVGQVTVFSVVLTACMIANPIVTKVSKAVGGKSRVILRFLTSLLLAVFVALYFSPIIHISPFYIVMVLTAVSLLPKPKYDIYAADTVYAEVWTQKVFGELMNTDQQTFLEGGGITDMSQYVETIGQESQVIHASYMGIDVEVLVNNTTYPIPIIDQGAEDIPIVLDRFDTKATRVTDDELYALNPDKMGIVAGNHARKINQSKYTKAIHAIAPASETASMPIIVTTGEDDGFGRKRLTQKDLVLFKQKLDDLQIPTMNRRLVLCSEHENDMLTWDQKFVNQWFSQDGKPFNLFGFEFHRYNGNPFYNVTGKTKKSFGSIPTSSDTRASVFFWSERIVVANGWVKMYYSPSSLDTLYHRNLMNFRHHYVALPAREDSRGAIISGKV